MTDERIDDLARAIRYDRATVYERTGNLGAAYNDYQVIHRATPGFGDVASRLEATGDRLTVGGRRNADAVEAETRGDVADAIARYEASVAIGYEGNHPYDRLAAIYRERGEHAQELRVLQAALDVVSRGSRATEQRNVDRAKKLRAEIDRAASALAAQIDKRILG